MRESYRSHLAIALVSFAVLFYQVAITRLLSVVLWYHFAFLSISLALLGVGAPGVWYALRRKVPDGNGELHRLLAAAGAAVPLSIFVIIKGIPLVRRTWEIQDSALMDPAVVVAMIAILLPFLLLGATVCLLLMRAEGRRIGPMYAADLVGATLGAIAVVPCMHWIATPKLLALVGLAPLLAAFLLRSRVVVPAILAVLVLGTVIWDEPYHLRFTKKYEESSILYEKWSPTGRIAVFPDVFYRSDPKEAFTWGMGANWNRSAIDQLWIEQDGSAGTPINHWDGTWNGLDHLRYDVTSVVYEVRPPEHVCVIGAGGGRDVLAALQAGATDISAVELNPYTIKAVSGPFRDFSGDVYGQPAVHPIVSEGRSFLTRAPQRFDLIQISMVDSWAATSAGAFALSENYLYTVESFELYWNRLADDGIISVSRWMLYSHLAESLRLAQLAKEVLNRLGVDDPGSHLAIIQGGAVATFLISKSAFDDADLARIDQVCATRGFLRHWPPCETTPGNSPIPGLLLDGVDTFEQAGLDLSPPTDDRPFFFQAVPILGHVDADLIRQLSVNEQAVILLRRLVIVIGLLAVALFFAPFAFGRRLRIVPEIWRGSGYFCAIGLAFLLVEAAWIQRFILYLGHPSYATTVVLAALLLGAGLGSLTAPRLPLGRAARWGFVLPVVLAVINLVLAPLFQGTLGLPIAGRIAISLVLLLPAGYLMGFGFPVGMIRFRDDAKPWFWAINGAFSVLASVLSLAAAMLIGHTAVAYVGTVAYVAAVLLLQQARRSVPA
ncbi:MAG: hypothetical protein R3E12_02580 [Candidatus Eisenbacteria bacterium]|uniref:Uncharacterized protein n=1 Tax=Eiseniibacteriota bacterium TaxID=2212470 RepID=A0A956LVE6_UNCEI|nr:hypothetical protein [Candidatus Eisenbacteria bacterium]